MGGSRPGVGRHAGREKKKLSKNKKNSIWAKPPVHITPREFCDSFRDPPLSGSLLYLRDIIFDELLIAFSRAAYRFFTCCLSFFRVLLIAPSRAAYRSFTGENIPKV